MEPGSAISILVGGLCCGLCSVFALAMGLAAAFSLSRRKKAAPRGSPSSGGGSRSVAVSEPLPTDVVPSPLADLSPVGTLSDRTEATVSDVPSPAPLDAAAPTPAPAPPTPEAPQQDAPAPQIALQSPPAEAAPASPQRDAQSGEASADVRAALAGETIMADVDQFEGVADLVRQIKEQRAAVMTSPASPGASATFMHDPDTELDAPPPPDRALFSEPTARITPADDASLFAEATTRLPPSLPKISPTLDPAVDEERVPEISSLQPPKGIGEGLKGGLSSEPSEDGRDPTTIMPVRKKRD